MALEPRSNPRPLRDRPLVAGLIIASVVLFVVAGCDNKPTQREPKAPPPPPTAEERFDRIVQSLKRRVENRSLTASDSIGSYDKPGAPITDATVRVTHELMPEDPEGAPRRGVVCFKTTSKVTVVLPQPDKSEDEMADKRRSREIAEMEEDLGGIADLDSLVVPSTDSLAGQLNSPIHEIDQGESSRCFEMEFRDGRWELLSELDRENEPFYTLQIEFALKRQ